MTRQIIVVAVVMLCICSSALHATIINVPASQPTIQAGIAAASAGDTVLIANGTYSGPGNTDIDMFGKNIRVIGASTPDSTVIDCGGADNGFTLWNSYSTSLSSIENLTIQNAIFGIDNGTISGFRSVPPAVRNVIITNCFQSGIYAVDVTIDSSRISHCTQNGIDARFASEVRDCQIDSNGVGCGRIESGTFARTSFIGNTVGITTSAPGPYPSIDSCEFVENDTALQGWAHITSTQFIGGAIGISAGYPWGYSVDNCVFDGISGTVFSGGGPGTSWDGASISNSTIRNCGTILSASAGETKTLITSISNCQIYDNSGGISAGGFEHRFSMTNSLYVNNGAISYNVYNPLGASISFSLSTSTIVNSGISVLTGPPGADGPINISNSIIMNSGLSLVGQETVSCNDFYLNGDTSYVGVSSNFSAEPLFCDTGNSDYSLSCFSPCAPNRNSCNAQIGAFGVACSGYCGPVWHVDPFGDDVTGDGSLSLPFATIQHAIDVAAKADTVLLSPGIYMENVSFMGKDLTLKSSDGPLSTRIMPADPNQPIISIVQGTTIGTVIDGITINGASSSYGIYVDSLIDTSATINMSNCTIRQCEVGVGGVALRDIPNLRFVSCNIVKNTSYGIRSSSNRVELTNSAVDSNSTGIYAFNCNLSLDTTDFSNNSIGYLVDYSNSSVTKCNFRNNGAAIQTFAPILDSIVMRDCMFLHNSYCFAGFGGTDGNIYMTGCTLDSGNIGIYEGGGEHLRLDSSTISNMNIGIQARAGGISNTLSNSVLSSNGTAVDQCCVGDVLFTSCTIVNNTDSIGSAFVGRYSVTALFENTIIAYNAGSQSLFCDSSLNPSNPPNITVRCSDIFANGNGAIPDCIVDSFLQNQNFSLPPKFCDTLSGDYSLSGGSPCLPEGNTCGVLVGALGIGCNLPCCDTPGDANNDGAFNIADVTFGIARIFSGGSAPTCQDEADSNGDNSYNIADVAYGIARIFSGGSASVCGTTGS